MSQMPHGSAVGPFSQERALARMRGALVFPTPRAPVKRKAWWTRFCAMALESVRATCSCPISSENRCGRYFRARTRYDTHRNLLGTVRLSIGPQMDRSSRHAPRLVGSAAVLTSLADD